MDGFFKLLISSIKGCAPLWILLLFASCAHIEKFTRDLSNGNGLGNSDQPRNVVVKPTYQTQSQPVVRSNAELARDNMIFQMRTVGITDSAEAVLWDSMGFSYEDARYWKANGITPAESKRWDSEGFSPHSSKDWLEFRFTIAEANNWKVANLEPKAAANWRSAGFSSEETSEWVKCFQSPDEAMPWKEKGVSPSVACGAQSIEVRTGGSVTFVSFSPEEAEEWGGAFGSLITAARFKNSGMSSKNAKTKLAGTLRKCSNKIGETEDLLSSNPFDTKGKCYEVSASGNQLLGRSHALYTISDGSSSQVAYVNFQGQSATSNFTGIVISNGAYKYTTTAGALAIVPSLSLLLSLGE